MSMALYLRIFTAMMILVTANAQANGFMFSDHSEMAGSVDLPPSPPTRPAPPRPSDPPPEKPAVPKRNYIMPMDGATTNRGFAAGHPGIDFNHRQYGAPVKAVKDGVIVAMNTGCYSYAGGSQDTGCGGGYGNYVVIKHPDGMFSLYAHFQACRALTSLRSGVPVKQGQQIGCMGSSGYSTGPHLHFEMKTSGAFDPSHHNCRNPAHYLRN